MKPPAFQFYPDDFVAGVSAMTQNEVGAYILLLCHQWSVGKLSSDVPRMEIVAKGKVSEHVLSKFPRLKNRRLEFEREKQRLFRESRSKNGKLGGRPCKASEKLVVLKTEPRKSSPSPSPSPSPINTNKGVGIEIFNEIEMRLFVLFKRKINGMPYSEQGDISRLTSRPEILEELAEIERFMPRSRKPPQSLFSLVSGWEKFVDQARNFKPERTPEDEKRFRNLANQL